MVNKGLWITFLRNHWEHWYFAQHGEYLAQLLVKVWTLLMYKTLSSILKKCMQKLTKVYKMSTKIFWYVFTSPPNSKLFVHWLQSTFFAFYYNDCHTKNTSNIVRLMLIFVSWLWYQAKIDFSVDKRLPDCLHFAILTVSKHYWTASYSLLWPSMTYLTVLQRTFVMQTTTKPYPVLRGQCTQKCSMKLITSTDIKCESCLEQGMNWLLAVLLIYLEYEHLCIVSILTPLL